MPGGERRPWSKFYDADYLADAEMNALPLHLRAIVHLMWAMLRTQTDEVGVFVRRSSPLSPELIAASLKAHTPLVEDWKRLRRWVVEALERGPFRQREDGAWFSPRIVRDAETFDRSSSNGKKGAAKRYAKETLYNRAYEKKAIADPIANAIATPIDRAEESRREQSSADARARDQAIASSTDPPPPVDEDATTEAINQIESMSARALTTDDRHLVEHACIGKTKATIAAALEQVRREYSAGKVRVLVPFACSVIRAQISVKEPVDKAERRLIAEARRVCATLNIPWEDFHMQVIDAIKRYPGRVTKAIALTWEDHRRAVLAKDATPAQWFDRFREHIEETLETARV